MKRKKVYFAASIRGGLQEREKYQELITQLSKNYIVLTEHLWSEVEKEKLTDEEIFQRDVAWIREADILVAEVSVPSLGVGWEIAFAESLGYVEIICLYKKGSAHPMSAMLSGNKNIKKIHYDSLEEVLSFLS